MGAIQGNDFVVTGGLAAGVEIVGSSIQKIHDGSPITRLSLSLSQARARPPSPELPNFDVHPRAPRRVNESMFVDFFIKRPIFAAVCSILIVLAGGICIPTLPIAQYPQIAMPQVSVSAFYIGANAEVVESSVTTPLEQAINGVEGMRYMTSTSANDGSCNISITFDPSRNIDVAAVDVQNRISTAQARLPNEVKQGGISVTKSSGSSLPRSRSSPNIANTISFSATTPTSI